MQTIAAANDVSVDAAIAVLFSELGGIFSLKEKQNTALKVFLSEQLVFISLLSDFGKGFSSTQLHIAGSHGAVMFG